MSVEPAGQLFSINDSIYYSVKKLAGLDRDYNAFDLDILTHLNSIFVILFQLGLGPDTPYQVTSPEETWADFIGEDDPGPLNMIREYISLKLRIRFDPPTSGILRDALLEQIKEDEFRLFIEGEERGRLHGNANPDKSDADI